MLRTGSAIITLFCTASFAFADQCDNPELSPFDAVYCQSKIFVTEDARLNKSYGELREMLSPSEQSTLLQAQKNWIAYRDGECVTHDETWGDAVYADCAVDTTRARAEFLEARMNECKSVGCQASKLSEY